MTATFAQMEAFFNKRNCGSSKGVTRAQAKALAALAIETGTLFTLTEITMLTVWDASKLIDSLKVCAERSGYAAQVAREKARAEAQAEEEWQDWYADLPEDKKPAALARHLAHKANKE